MISETEGLKRIRKDGYDATFTYICENAVIDKNVLGRRFVYFIDPSNVLDTTVGYRYENLTPNYSKMLKSGLAGLKYQKADCTNEFCVSYNNVIDGMILLIGRITTALKENKLDQYERKIQWFTNMIDQPAEHFEEAIQRMLFLNQMLWQCDHRLVGLGRWDQLLIDLYNRDKNNGLINEEQTKCVFEDLIHILHDNYEYKSSVMKGDTGQIFILGGSDTEGHFVGNELTLLLIQSLKKANLPDPKILLRVTNDMPRIYMDTALDCIAGGCGSPLLSNDEVIIPKLTSFGVPLEDAVGYTTAACWEPLIGGKSSSINNMTTLNYLKALDNMMKRENLNELKDFDAFFEKYLVYLNRNLKAIQRIISLPRFQYDPLLSVFIDDCFENKKDISHGGARYKNTGITTVAMGNTVNALLNIRDYVYDHKIISLADVKRMLIHNFEGNEDVLALLKGTEDHYGCDDSNVISMVNRIASQVSESIKDFRNYLGGKLKFGYSAPSYIDAARNFGASFDGRKAGEPFQVHISNDCSDGYTELINFAGALSYDDNRFNGNVVDYMVSPEFIKNNKDKFIDFLYSSIRVGFFQMQMNVVSSDILIQARKEPDKYPGLIVRVWGFSAFFNDLSDEYKEVLINRALDNENKQRG